MRAESPKLLSTYLKLSILKWNVPTPLLSEDESSLADEMIVFDDVHEIFDISAPFSSYYPHEQDDFYCFEATTVPSPDILTEPVQQAGSLSSTLPSFVSVTDDFWSTTFCYPSCLLAMISLDLGEYSPLSIHCNYCNPPLCGSQAVLLSHNLGMFWIPWHPGLTSFLIDHQRFVEFVAHQIVTHSARLHRFFFCQYLTEKVAIAETLNNVSLSVSLIHKLVLQRCLDLADFDIAEAGEDGHLLVQLKSSRLLLCRVLLCMLWFDLEHVISHLLWCGGTDHSYGSKGRLLDSLLYW